MLKLIISNFLVSGVTALAVTLSLKDPIEDRTHKTTRINSVAEICCEHERATTANTTNMEGLRQDMQSLVEYQDYLTDQSQTLMAKVSQLEKELDDQLSTKEKTALSMQEYNDSVTDVNLDSQLELAAQQELQVFEDMKNQILNEEYDDHWGLEMDAAFQEVHQRLQDSGINNAEILEKDCHSKSCYVEFSYPRDINATVFTAMVIPQGISNIMFNHSDEEDVVITRAIYTR